MSKGTEKPSYQLKENGYGERKQPRCHRVTCFANIRGQCDCLTEIRFMRRGKPYECPFYQLWSPELDREAAKGRG